MAVLETKLVVEIVKDLCAHLLSFEDEDVDSVIFMVFGFHSVGMPYPRVLVFRSQMESKESRGWRFS